MGTLNQENLDMYPSEDNLPPEEILMTPEQLDAVDIKVIQTQARILRNQTVYGTNLVDTDETDITQRTINTCTLPASGSAFSDISILNKLCEIAKKDSPEMEKKTYVLHSSGEIRHPRDLSQLTVSFDWLIPSDRGHLTEQGRDHGISMTEYIKYLVELHHGGFRTPFCIQQLYNFRTRYELWERMRVQSRLTIDGIPCAELYSKIPMEDINTLIEYFKAKQLCALKRLPFPPIPSNLKPGTRHFLNNIKCVSATIPHSNAAALSKRACYFALIAQKGNPLFWFTANSNAVENQIVLHMINGRVLPFGNLSFVEKNRLASSSPGSVAIYFLELCSCIARVYTGIPSRY